MHNIPPPVIQHVAGALAPFLPDATEDRIVSALKREFSPNHSEIKLPSQKYLREKELEKYLNCSYWTAKRLRDSGRLKSFKHGRQVFYKLSDIEAYLEGCRKRGGSTK